MSITHALQGVFIVPPKFLFLSWAFKKTSCTRIRGHGYTSSIAQSIFIERPKKKQQKYYSGAPWVYAHIWYLVFLRRVSPAEALSTFAKASAKAGKKKRHPLKTEIQITGKGEIVHLSNPHPGRDHDMNVRKQGPPLHPNVTTHVDSGDKDLPQYHGNTDTLIKNQKTNRLQLKKRSIIMVSKFRVRVEHKTRELKIFKILKEPYRNHRKGFGIAVNIVAGIINLKAGF